MTRTFHLLLAMFMMLPASQTHAALTFDLVVNAGAGVNSSFDDNAPALSADGLTLVFSSNRPGGSGNYDLYMASRTSVFDPFGPATNMGTTLNSSFSDLAGSISNDGLTFYFVSTRNSLTGQGAIFVSTRSNTAAAWGTPIELIGVNSGSDESSPDISADGLTLLFSSARAGGVGDYDLWQSTRTAVTDPFLGATDLGIPLSSTFREGGPHLSADGLTLLFDSTRPGGVGTRSIWLATRATTASPFTAPILLSSPINSGVADGQPYLARDGSFLVFQSFRSGGFGDGDIWIALNSAAVPEPGTASIWLLTAIGLGFAFYRVYPGALRHALQRSSTG